jgi:hypothetical protein
VTGERQFVDRREDPHPYVSVVLGGQHEHRLGEVHLAGEALHALGGQPGGGHEHRDRVAGQRLFGEDVGDDIFVHLSKIACIRPRRLAVGYTEAGRLTDSGRRRYKCCRP